MEEGLLRLWRDADGRHQRKLGPAWVKDSGRRTPRGAVRWSARDGSKPDGYLTPADADGLLHDLLAHAPRRPTRSPRTPPAAALTLRAACDEWLRWAEHDSEVKRSTLGDYGNVGARICRDLGADTRVSTLTTVRLERWIADFQAERRISPKEADRRRAPGANVRRLADGQHVHLTPANSRTKRKYLVNLDGVMKRAMKLGAITSNPVALDRPGRVRNRQTLRHAAVRPRDGPGGRLPDGHRPGHHGQVSAGGPCQTGRPAGARGRRPSGLDHDTVDAGLQHRGGGQPRTATYVVGGQVTGTAARWWWPRDS